MTEVTTYTPQSALETYQDAAVARLGDWARAADAAYLVAQKLVTTAFCPEQFRDQPGEATAAILAGLEVGLQPMAALRAFDIIRGQAAPRAITLRAVAQSFGHELVLVESTATRCRMKGRRRGSQEWQTVTWTIDRAQSLGLVSKDNWKKQPGAMLVARATSELARLVASDALLGIGYSAEEIADGGAFEAEVATTTTTSTPPGSRKMSRRMQVVDVPTEPDEREPEQPAEIESPYLDTSSGLAKKMFALFGDVGITDKPKRLDYVSRVIGREVTTSKEMTDADANDVIAALERDLAEPFGDGGEPA